MCIEAVLVAWLQYGVQSSQHDEDMFCHESIPSMLLGGSLLCYMGSVAFCHRRSDARKTYSRVLLFVVLPALQLWMLSAQAGIMIRVFF